MVLHIICIVVIVIDVNLGCKSASDKQGHGHTSPKHSICPQLP